MTINDLQKWNSQIEGKGGLLSSFNQRNFLLRRVQKYLGKEQTKKVAYSIWTSKLRYGLQFYGKVRRSDLDPLSSELDKLQKAHNMLRTLEHVRVRDKVSIKSMFEKNKMLSLNQTNAQSKLTELWKSKNR